MSSVRLCGDGSPHRTPNLHTGAATRYTTARMDTRDGVMDIETVAPTAADADWQARVDLAAVYRLLAHHGWGDVIFNHAAMRVPVQPAPFPDQAP